MALLQKNTLGCKNCKDGILLSLLYLSHEVASAGMLQTKESLDGTLVVAIKEYMLSEISEEDAVNITKFLEKALKLNEVGIEYLIATITSFEEN